VGRKTLTQPINLLLSRGTLTVASVANFVRLSHISHLTSSFVYNTWQ